MLTTRIIPGISTELKIQNTIPCNALHYLVVPINQLSYIIHECASNPQAVDVLASSTARHSQVDAILRTLHIFYGTCHESSYPRGIQFPFPNSVPV